jgi:small subunit ribosomal protein S8
MLDPIADMLTRIRNAQRAGRDSVSMPASKLKREIARILEKEGFILRSEKESLENNKENLIVWLKYIPVSLVEKAPAIHEIRRVSKEGRRVYVKKGEIKKVKNGFGMAVVSTSKGVMSGVNAYRQGLGGELICEVW